MPVIAIVGAGPGMGFSLSPSSSAATASRDRPPRPRPRQARHTHHHSERPRGERRRVHRRRQGPALPGGSLRADQPAPRPGGRAGVLARHPRGRPGRTAQVYAGQPSAPDRVTYGAVTAAAQVLPAMRKAGAGTLLFTTGGGSINPNPAMVGNINAASAALRNWVLNLNQLLDGTGVYAGHVAISAWIGSAPALTEPDAIAATYWDLHRGRYCAEVNYVA